MTCIQVAPGVIAFAKGSRQPLTESTTTHRIDAASVRSLFFVIILLFVLYRGCDVLGTSLASRHVTRTGHKRSSAELAR